MKKDNVAQKNAEKRKMLRKRINKFLSNNFKWFIIIVIITIFTFGYYFLIKPKYEETLRLVKVISRQDEINVQGKQKELEEIKEFLLAYSKIEKKYIKKVNKIIPQRYNQEELFTELNHIVSKNGLILQSVSIEGGGGDEKKAPSNGEINVINLKRITIKLNVHGTDYRAFKTLISSFENNLKLMDIIDITFSPRGQSALLLVNTYYIE